MKKFNLSTRGKRSLIAVGSALVCVTVVTLVATLTTGAKAPEQPVTVSSSSTVTSVDVSVGDIAVESGSSSNDAAFVPSSGVSQTTQLTKIEKPSSTPPKPVVKGDSSTSSNGKKTQPTNSALTNKNQKPSYASKPTATTSKPSTTTSSKPSGGKPGYSYDPVFGWTKDTGGETIVVSGMHEGGSQVGIMD